MKQVKIVMLVLTLFGLNCSWAQTKVKIGDLYYNLSGDIASVASSVDLQYGIVDSDYKQDSYIIPSDITYNGLTYKVTSLSNNAFGGNGYDRNGSTAKSIIMPNTITKIGILAFMNCKNLTSLVIPSSVEKFDCNDYRTFYGCDRLRELIYLPAKAPSEWSATSKTYVPDLSSYRTPKWKVNDNAQIIEMISFNQIEFDYTGQAPNTTWTNNVEDYTASLSLSSISGDVGSHEEWIPVTFTKGNESFTANVVFRYIVKPAKLNAKVTNVSREYGEENPQFAITYYGFVNGENESVITTLPTISYYVCKR